jgi:hypothetical protein
MTIAEMVGCHDLIRAFLEARLEQTKPVVRYAVPVQDANNAPVHVHLGHPLQMTNLPLYARNIAVAIQPSVCSCLLLNQKQIRMGAT